MARKLNHNPNVSLQWQASLIDCQVTLNVVDNCNYLEVVANDKSVHYEVTVLEVMALFYLSNSPYEAGHTNLAVEQVTEIMYEHCKELNKMIMDDTGVSCIP